MTELTVMLWITGGVFCGRYGTSTESITAVLRAGHSARHWIKRAGGLIIRASSALLMGADHALQVASGRAATPVRVVNTTPEPVPCHGRRPHRETVAESRTCDT